jgi:hypothetical protein
VDGDPRRSGPGFGLTLHWDKIEQPLKWRDPRFVIFSPQWAVAPRCRPQVVSKKLIDQLDRIAQTIR